MARQRPKIPADVREQATAGAKFLDKRRPGWAATIDADKIESEFHGPLADAWRDEIRKRLQPA
jgi:hypothetical protein